MPKETEKIFQEFHKYLEDHPDQVDSLNDFNELFGSFVEQYNQDLPLSRQPVTEATAKSSDDYLELAENARNEAQALKYVKQALKLDPDNLDAEVFMTGLTARSADDHVRKLRKVVEHGKQILEKEGFFDKEYIGDFWGFWETRPYMRARNEYIQMLLETGKMRAAQSECEDMLHLCEEDNLGVRYILMHIYAYLEEEKEALKLHDRFEKSEETQMLLPLSILYYKLDQEDRAEDYLHRLIKVNPDTRKFIKGLNNGEAEKLIENFSDFGYRPFTIEELMTEMVQNEFLFGANTSYVPWAAGHLTIKKKK